MTTTSRCSSAAACDGLGAVAGLVDHFEIGLTLDEEFQPLPDRLMVFYQEYAQEPCSPLPPSVIYCISVSRAASVPCAREKNARIAPTRV